MKYLDIPQFYPEGNYAVTTSWDYIERILEDWNERGELDLDPDFQRGHVWSEKKQIDFVEFCLKGGKESRTIKFNHPGWQSDYEGKMVLVDGKQRLEAVRKFMRNELPIFGGHFLGDFEDMKIMLRSLNASLIFMVNNLKTRKEVLTWYLQLNSGGVVHTQEEIEKVEKLLELEP